MKNYILRINGEEFNVKELVNMIIDYMELSKEEIANDIISHIIGFETYDIDED